MDQVVFLPNMKRVGIFWVVLPNDYQESCEFFYLVELSLWQSPPIITWTQVNADLGKETQSTGAPGNILSNWNYAASVTYSARGVQDGTWEPHLSDLIPHVKGKTTPDPARATQSGRNVL